MPKHFGILEVLNFSILNAKECYETLGKAKECVGSSRIAEEPNTQLVKSKSFTNFEKFEILEIFEIFDKES